jgi:hypothetical protein
MQLNRQKVGIVVILLPALGVVVLSVLIELSLSHGTHISIWQRVSPFAVAWGIGLVLVAGFFLFIKWAAGRGGRKP